MNNMVRLKYGFELDLFISNKLFIFLMQICSHHKSKEWIVSASKSNYQELAKLAQEYPELVRLQVKNNSRRFFSYVPFQLILLFISQDATTVRLKFGDIYFFNFIMRIFLLLCLSLSLFHEHTSNSPVNSYYVGCKYLTFLYLFHMIYIVLI